VKDPAAPKTAPGALVVDMGPVQDFERALDRLEETWAAIPPHLRSRLSRLVWMHPDGEVVIYRAPDGPPVEPPKEG
jgi:hypothetical protein